MKKRAIISVYDKHGIVEFAKELSQKHNYEIVSTGGTYTTLKDNGIEVTELSSVTGYPEMIGGRVKSLHPAIHAGILVSKSNDEDVAEIKKHNIEPFDMVVVNLYPFEDASKDIKMDVAKLIEFIDIGGVTLLRAAAKNYFSVTPVYTPDLYSKILDNLVQNNGEVSYDMRKELAIDTFQYTAIYDSIISEQLYSRAIETQTEQMPNIFNMVLSKKQNLRYGENPHQMASLYDTPGNIQYEVLNGKELSYNNIVDTASALNIVSEFPDVPAACIIKHNNPCGAALGENITEAFQKAFDCDPISAFGGIIGLNRTVTKEIAKIAKDVFLEVIVAPEFEDEALEILKTKKNLRLVKLNTDFTDYKYAQKIDMKMTPFGALVQTADKGELDKSSLNVVTKKKPDEKMVEDMVFAWKVVKHVKSNAIVVVKDKKTIGIGMGQTSRIGSMDIALNQACEGTKDAVIASDGFFPAVDNIHAAAQARIAAIIQPGGSIKDKDVIAECDKYNISMVTTSMRHFNH